MNELNEKIKRVFSDLRIRCAYNMPIFWANGGKDYKVIPTKYAKGYQDALEDAEREITEVLSAQPERQKGEWIYGEDEYGIDGYHCNKCGFFVPWDYAHTFINYIKDYSFCPNCGEKMERRDG